MHNSLRVPRQLHSIQFKDGVRWEKAASAGYLETAWSAGAAVLGAGLALGAAAMITGVGVLNDAANSLVGSAWKSGHFACLDGGWMHCLIVVRHHSHSLLPSLYLFSLCPSQLVTQ